MALQAKRLDVAAPPANQWKLTDLIDVRTLQSIQDTFARAFGLPTVIVHPDGTNATDITHRVTFCEDLTRNSAVGGPRCADCDLSAMRKAAGSGRPAIFKCWNGLYDCAIPISSRGLTLGYFLCGQVTADPPDVEAYRQTAGELGVNGESYVDALADVRQVDFGRYEASVQSMHVLAGMIAEQAAAAFENLATLEDAEVARADAARLLGELDAILEGLREVGSQPDYQSTLQAMAGVLDQLIPWDSCVIYLVNSAETALLPVVVRDPYPAAIAHFEPRMGQSIVGTVAVTGVGRRVDDVTQDADFEPIPQVPIEPEAMLVVPMVYRDAVSGVIVLSRFERRTFTDHELRVLTAFSSQASVSIQLAKLASDNAVRLREEQAFTALLRTMSTSASVDATLCGAARIAVDLFDAEAILIEARTAAGGLAERVTHGISKADATELRSDLEDVIRTAGEHDTAQRVEWRNRMAAVIPIAAARDAHAVVVLLAGADHEWDGRLMHALASQLGLGLERLRLHERELIKLREYRQLSELGTELAHTPTVPDLERCLLSRVRGMFSADTVWLALLADGPDAIEVVILNGPEVQRHTIRLEGPGRIAALRLRDEMGCGRSVFESWAHEVERAVHAQTGMRSSIAEILSVSTGALGGLFVGWRQPVPAPAVDEAHTLGLVASVAGASLARLLAHEQTDARLRDRVSDLEAMTQLAQRLTGLRDEQSIFEEVLLALRRLGHLDGAAFIVREEDAPVVRAASGLSSVQNAALIEAYRPQPAGALPVRVQLPGEDSEAVFLSVAFGTVEACFAGIGHPESDPHRDHALQMIVRYGSVALENAELHHRQQLAISRLEHRNREVSEQTEKLERVLSVHETLASAVLQGRGLGSVAALLAAFIDGELVMVGSDDRRLASWPAETDIPWRPDVRAPATGTQEFVLSDGAHLVAAPAVLEGDQLAWVVARLTDPPDDVDRAAVEYGALLTALELLRERTANEVEARLRGGLLEDLFAGEFVAELISQQALALGVDLSRTSSVYLIEAIERPRAADRTPIDPERILGPAAALARSIPGALVSLRGRAVAAIVPEPSDAGQARFEQRLRKVLEQRFPDLACAIAVGTECNGPADYRNSFRAARRGLDLLRLQDRHNDTFSFRQASMATILLRSSDPAVIMEFIARYVDPLDAYDAEHASELRHSAEAYFETGGNLERTARQLHVHVSTLRYRLGRIAELLSISLKDQRALLDLQVALEAVKAMGVHRGAGAGSAHRQQTGTENG